MKAIIRIAAVLALSVAAPAFPAFAHPGGHEEDEMTVGRPEAITKAKAVVDTMIGRSLLDASWKGLNPTTSDLKEGRTGGIEWVVVFKNPKAPDPAKQTLYVFLSGSGMYLAANHTGK
jgi:hypothetical protein